MPIDCPLSYGDRSGGLARHLLHERLCARCMHTCMRVPMRAFVCKHVQMCVRVPVCAFMRA
jgi:hypothetical protein